MRSLAIILCLAFLGVTEANGQYSRNKLYYDSRDYVYQPDDPYHPILCGAASYLLPGLGQIIADEPGRGLLFTGAYAGSFAVAAVGFFNMYPLEPGRGNPDGAALLIAGLAGTVVSWAWSIGDAVKVAKINNLAYRDSRNTAFKLGFTPYTSTNTSVVQNRSTGVSLTLKF